MWIKKRERISYQRQAKKYTIRPGQTIDESTNALMNDSLRKE